MIVIRSLYEEEKESLIPFYGGKGWGGGWGGWGEPPKEAANGVGVFWKCESWLGTMEPKIN